MFIVKMLVIGAALCATSAVDAKHCCCAKHREQAVITQEEQPVPPTLKKPCDQAQETECELAHVEESAGHHAH